MNEQIVDKVSQLTDEELSREQIEQLYSSLSQEEQPAFEALIQQQAAEDPEMAKMVVWNTYVWSGIYKKGLSLLYEEKKPVEALEEFKKALPYLERTDPETQYVVYAYMVISYNGKYEGAPKNYLGGGRAPQEEFAEIWAAFRKVEELWPECERMEPPENLPSLHKSLMKLKTHFLYEALIRLEGYKEPEEISEMKLNNPEGALEELKKWFAYKDEFEELKTSGAAQSIVLGLCIEYLAASQMAYGESSEFPEDDFNHTWAAIQSLQRIVSEQDLSQLSLPVSAGEFRQGVEEAYQQFAPEYSRRTGETPPQPQTQAPKSSGGCFIATAVYGTKNAPAVLVLRDFRDNVLLPAEIGRVLVNLYYLISPPIARLLRANLLLRNMVRRTVVQPIVNLIRSKLYPN